MHNLDFIVIDVETANEDMASICQIGIAKYINGKLNDEWGSLINPEDYFSEINKSIHGIEEKDISNAPLLPETINILSDFLNNSVCVCHTHFDRVSLSKAFIKYKIKPLNITWLDSARVARRTWKDVAYRGYGLANLCEKIGYEFEHHNALEDAKAAGRVLLAALEISGKDIDFWLKRVRQAIHFENGKPSSGASVQREGNTEGELYGEVVAFTGALEVPRCIAADYAAKLGCFVGSGGNVTKKTSILVVGDQDITKLAGKKKSAKHLKAEKFIAQGQIIRILKESDFMGLIDHSL